MKKILYIHHATGWGGATISLIELIKSLDKSKYESTVFLLKDSVVTEKFKNEGIDYVIAKSKFYAKYYSYFAHSEAEYVRWYNIIKFLKLSVFWLLSRLIFARREIKNIDFDLVHLNSSVLTDWLAPCGRKAKTVIHIREPFRKGKVDICHSFFKGQMKKHADQIIAISKDNANRVGLLDKTKVIYNYANETLSTVNQDAYSSQKFLFLGGTQKIKGFETIANALDYLEKGVIIYFCGHMILSLDAGSKIKKVIKVLTGYGVRQKHMVDKVLNHPQVKVLGLVNNVDLLLDEVCCMVSPFTVPHFSRPVIESYLSNKAVIGSDIDGMDEIVFHEQTGLIFPVNDARALANAINFIALHPKESEMMGKNGYEIAKDKFSSKNILYFEGVYKSLLFTK